MARLAQALLTLRLQVDALAPKRSRLSDGWLGDAAHQAVKSEHNPNTAGVVTALDLTHDPKNGADMNVLKELLIRDPRTWYVIFNKKIWEAGTWSPYNGDNPHDKHLHISTKQTAQDYDNARNWQVKEEVVYLTRHDIGREIKSHWGRDATEKELTAYAKVEAGEMRRRICDDPQTDKALVSRDKLNQKVTELSRALEILQKNQNTETLWNKVKQAFGK